MRPVACRDVPTVRVAVCTNRRPAALGECLAALAEQGAGAGALLVTSGLAESAAAEHARAAAPLLPGVAVLREPRPGLSAARNRALAACAEDEVVAFIDDDAVVGAGWRERLSAAWAAAGERVGCIGGPIRPRFDAGRPDWLGDAILPMLTALDLGPAPRDLDPRERVVFGANFSFRVRALRGVGGFDERWGHRGDRSWFGEDDEAQLALARAGWIVRYAPEPWVWHVIPPERTRPMALLGRRLRHGAAVRRRGRRGPALAARWLASNALLAPVAALRGDRARAMERLLHAAENLGVLVDPFLPQ
jgi:succinoglycan biosynthesis protein ExoM